MARHLNPDHGQGYQSHRELTRRYLKPRVKALQILGYEMTVLSQQLAVEPDLAASVVLSLNLNQVPMHAAPVAVVGVVVSVARREMKAAADLFVEERVKHWVPHPVVCAQRPLAAIASAFVGIENVIDLLCFVGFSPDNLSCFELELNVFKHSAPISRLRIEADHPVDTVADRGSKDFAVGDIPVA